MTILKTKTNTKTEYKDKDKTIPKTKTKDMDKTIPKTKTEDKDMLDKINNKISTINETSTILAKIMDELNNKIKLIYESMCELHDDVYSDDSCLKLVELNKIDAIIDDALNVS